MYMCTVQNVQMYMRTTVHVMMSRHSGVQLFTPRYPYETVRHGAERWYGGAMILGGAQPGLSLGAAQISHSVYTGGTK